MQGEDYMSKIPLHYKILLAIRDLVGPSTVDAPVPIRTLKLSIVWLS